MDRIVNSYQRVNRGATLSSTLRMNGLRLRTRRRNDLHKIPLDFSVNSLLTFCYFGCDQVKDLEKPLVHDHEH